MCWNVVLCGICVAISAKCGCCKIQQIWADNSIQLVYAYLLFKTQIYFPLTNENLLFNTILSLKYFRKKMTDTYILVI